MISASVFIKLSIDECENTYSKLSDISEWLEKNVGPGAPFLDCISDERPWSVGVGGGEGGRGIKFHFHREEDAVLFALRWA
jgi:hypothetical protein